MRSFLVGEQTQELLIHLQQTMPFIQHEMRSVDEEAGKHPAVWVGDHASHTWAPAIIQACCDLPALI